MHVQLIVIAQALRGQGRSSRRGKYSSAEPYASARLLLALAVAIIEVGHLYLSRIAPGLVAGAT